MEKYSIVGGRMAGLPIVTAMVLQHRDGEFFTLARSPEKAS